jgi:hypothetical protein
MLHKRDHHLGSIGEHMKDETDLAREEFLKQVKNLGFAVNVQGREAYENRSKGEEDNSWATKPKERDKFFDSKEEEKS